MLNFFLSSAIEKMKTFEGNRDNHRFHLMNWEEVQKPKKGALGIEKLKVRNGLSNEWRAIWKETRNVVGGHYQSYGGGNKGSQVSDMI